MTQQEAIKKIKDQKRLCFTEGYLKVQGITEALDMAIKSLEGYDHECIIKHLSGGCSYNETGCSDCIGKEKIRIALEKQNAKKPNEIDERAEDDFYYLAFVCPSCHYPIHGQPYRPDYCKHCGQKLDWSNENE